MNKHMSISNCASSKKRWRYIISFVTLSVLLQTKLDIGQDMLKVLDLFYVQSQFCFMEIQPS